MIVAEFERPALVVVVLQTEPQMTVRSVSAILAETLTKALKRRRSSFDVLTDTTNTYELQRNESLEQHQWFFTLIESLPEETWMTRIPKRRLSPF